MPLPEIFRAARQAKLEAMFPDDPRWSWKREPVSEGLDEDLYPRDELPERSALEEETHWKRKLAWADPEAVEARRRG